MFGSVVNSLPTDGLAPLTCRHSGVKIDMLYIYWTSI